MKRYFATSLVALVFIGFLGAETFGQFGEDFDNRSSMYGLKRIRQAPSRTVPKQQIADAINDIAEKLNSTDSSDFEKLQQKLEVRTTIELDENVTFEQLFGILKEKHGIQSIIDPRGAGALGITLSSPIVREPFRLEGVPLRRILQMILREQDLTYVIDEGFLQITSENESKRYMKIKVYPVADLLVELDPDEPVVFGDSPEGSFSASRREMGMDWNKLDFCEIMDLIEATVSPDSWDDGGEMMEFYPGLCLVVRQTDEVHDQIENLLAELRAKRAEPSKKISESKTAVRRNPPMRYQRHRRF